MLKKASALVRVFRKAGKRNVTVSRANVGKMAGISDKYEQAHSNSELVSSTLSFLSFVFFLHADDNFCVHINLCAWFYLVRRDFAGS